MKTTIFLQPFSLLLLLFLGCQLGYAKDLEASKSKELNKTWAWTPGKTVQLDNRYGEMSISHWDKKEVALRIVVEVKARNNSVAQDILNGVSIQFSEEGDLLSARTSLKEWEDHSNFQLDIRYYVNLPEAAKCNLAQRYGNILMMGKHTGDSRIECRYGSIELGDFIGYLDLECRYGKLKARNLSRAELEFRYCNGVEIQKGDDIQIENRYSEVTTGDIRKLDIDIRYGSLKTGAVRTLDIDSQYSSSDIGELLETMNIDRLSYGNLTLLRVAKDFSRIRGESQYGTLELNIPGNASFWVNAGGFKYGNCKVKGFKNLERVFEGDEDYEYSVNGGKGGKITFDANGFGNLHIFSL